MPQASLDGLAGLPMKTKITNRHHLLILAELRKHARKASDSQLQKMKSYIGTTKPFYLMQTGVERQIARDWVRKHSDLSRDECVALLTSLYRGESHNEICMASRLLGSAKIRKNVAPRFIDAWLSRVEGWGETDSICQSNFSGEEVLAKWEEWENLLKKLVFDENVHKRRASLVLLTRPVRESADRRLADLAFANIDRLMCERSILITKAVSWLLRDLIKNHRQRVAAHLDENEALLPRIAVRETRNKLLTGRKCRGTAFAP